MREAILQYNQQRERAGYQASAGSRLPPDIFPQLRFNDADDGTSRASVRVVILSFPSVVQMRLVWLAIFI